jgi:hypothetical protein
MGGNRRCAVWSGMGTGKTSSVLTYLDACYSIMGESAPTLIIGPKRVARDVWPEEQKKWRHLQGLEIAVAVGDADARRAALARDVPIVTVNYDVLPQLVDHYAERKKAWPFKRVVADESSKLRGFRLKQGGVQTAALGRHAHKDVTDFIQLTGTPAPNGLKTLWGSTWFLDAGQRLGRTYSSYMERWFQTLPGPRGFSQVRELPHAQDEIQHLLRDIVLTIDPKDWFDLREPLVNTVEVTMPAHARAKYRDMEKEAFVAFESGEEVEAFAAGAKRQKCVQLASGAVYLDPERYGPGKWVETHHEKLEALESIVEEAGGMPVLVAIWFKSSRERILKAFTGAVDLATDEGMAAFRAGTAPIGIAHPASLGHGIDGLQDVTCHVAFFDQFDDLELAQQIVERVGPMRQFQSGNDRLVTIHNIVAKGTLDEDIVERRKTKASVQDMLRDAMRRRA